MSMAYECDMEEEVCVSSPLAEEGDPLDKVVHFKETFKHLEVLAKCLVCIKCNKLPKDKVWMLGCCLAKYCESCAGKTSGSSCHACGQTSYPKDTRPDLISSSILSEVPAIYMTIMKLEELSCGDNKSAEDGGADGECDKQQVDEVSDVVVNEDGKQEMEIEKIPDPLEVVDMEQEIHGTPQDQVMTSQDYPEVLEETPQNKVVGRVRASLSSRRSAKKAAARSLKLTSQKKETTITPVEKVVTKAKTPSPQKNDQSDEELFQQSPVPPPAPVNDRKSPAEFPILTPYGNTSAVNNKQKLTTDTPLKGEDEKGRKPRLSTRSTRGINRFRSPDEEKLPVLTPHKKEKEGDNDEEEDFESTVRKPTTRSRKSSASSTDSRKLAKGRGQKVQAKEVDNNGDEEEDFKNTLRKPTTRSRKSSASSTDSRKSANGRGRKVQPKEAKASSLLLSKGKSPGFQPKVVMEDIYRSNSRARASSSDRKRRVSSASVASNASSTTPMSKEKRNPKGETKLHVACRAGVLEKVQSLLDEGADVNASDNAGWTPIHELINGKGDLESKVNILRILCEKNCNVNEYGGPDDETPLHLAAQMGGESLVEILLEFNASPNIRTLSGKYPKDIAFNDVILKMLEDKMAVSTTSPNVSMTLNSSVLSEDHALMQAMLKKAFVYFNYDVDKDTLKATKKKLNLNVSNELGPTITHVIHKFNDEKEKSSSCVHISKEFLYALAKCMWQVNSDWITDSLQNDGPVVPCSYEILGCLEIKRDDTDEAVPGIARVNKETGNPGLLDGFSFYLYKTCGYNSETLKLPKKNLAEIITAAGGIVINREPNPETIDPLEAPRRFHVLNNVRGSDDSSVYSVTNLTLTTHIYLYKAGSPPPNAKRYKYEHVKSLKSDWVIDSLAQFRLQDPLKYL